MSLVDILVKLLVPFSMFIVMAIIGIDLQEVEPVNGAEIHQLDFLEDGADDQVEAHSRKPIRYRRRGVPPRGIAPGRWRNSTTPANIMMKTWKFASSVDSPGPT